jgi:hypothetical protein
MRDILDPELALLPARLRFRTGSIIGFESRSWRRINFEFDFDFSLASDC